MLTLFMWDGVCHLKSSFSSYPKLFCMRSKPIYAAACKPVFQVGLILLAPYLIYNGVNDFILLYNIFGLTNLRLQPMDLRGGGPLLKAQHAGWDWEFGALHEGCKLEAPTTRILNSSILEVKCLLLEDTDKYLQSA